MKQKTVSSEVSKRILTTHPKKAGGRTIRSERKYLARPGYYHRKDLKQWQITKHMSLSEILLQ